MKARRRNDMELIVFDLDGTLLDCESQITPYTSETLRLLSEREIAYTVATGRTLHGARAILEGHRFELPQAYKNGVMIWHPDEQRFSSRTVLTAREVENVVRACVNAGVTPFVFTLDERNESAIYHPPVREKIEEKLVRSFADGKHIPVHPLDELPAEAPITHVNAIGRPDDIRSVLRSVDDEPNLVAYSGIALEGEAWRWIDIHHSDASKGGAVRLLKKQLGIQRVICFGDSENDLSMFEAADEAYAPANASETIRSAATAVIGRHDEEGIARFLRERFSLG